MNDPRQKESCQDPILTPADSLAGAIVFALFGALNGLIVAWGLDAPLVWRIGAGIGGALILGGAWFLKPFRSYCSKHYRAIHRTTGGEGAAETIANVDEGSLRQQFGYQVVV